MRIFILMLTLSVIHAEDSLGERFAKYYKISPMGIGDLSDVVSGRNYKPVELSPDQKRQMLTYIIKDDSISDGYVIKIYYGTTESIVKVNVSGGIAGLSKDYGLFTVDENGVIRE